MGAAMSPQLGRALSSGLLAQLKSWMVQGAAHPFQTGHLVARNAQGAHHTWADLQNPFFMNAL